MVHCDDGMEYVVDWSSGHADATEEKSLAKARQYLASGTGPSTCVKFGEDNPDGCVGCPHLGKIRSPIVLGRPEPESLVPKTVEDETPTGFKRTETGLYYEEEGRWFRFYDQDLKIERLAFDETLGFQVAVIKHRLPHDGCLEFSIRSSLIHDPKALMTTLSDNHVHVVGQKEKKIMVAYFESYMSKLQRMTKMTMLMNQMGWKTDNEGKPFFVLGQKIFYHDGTIKDASLARHVPSAAKGFRSAGDLNLWAEATKLLDQPGMEPYAFALLCGFAAPLTKFTGFAGALVSMVGDSGIGKTLMLRFNQSIYGFHEDLIMLKDDTRNALISRLGTYGNLPMAIDEVTNQDGLELSEFVYRITQGRDKVRLTKNSEERKVINNWNTLACVSTNSSLIDKL
jgi:hypothetical protein